MNDTITIFYFFSFLDNNQTPNPVITTTDLYTHYD